MTAATLTSAAAAESLTSSADAVAQSPPSRRHCESTGDADLLPSSESRVRRTHLPTDPPRTAEESAEVYRKARLERGGGRLDSEAEMLAYMDQVAGERRRGGNDALPSESVPSLLPP